MLSESYLPRGPREYLSRRRGKIPSWLFTSRSLILSRPELCLYNCPVTEQRLTKPKSVLLNSDCAITSGLRITLIETYKWRLVRFISIWSVRLAKLFSRIRVSRNSISMPMTSGTESSADFHISLSCVSSTTSTTKDNQYEQHEYMVPQLNHIFNNKYKIFLQEQLNKFMNTLEITSYMIFF